MGGARRPELNPETTGTRDAGAIESGTGFNAQTLIDNARDKEFKNKPEEYNKYLTSFYHGVSAGDKNLADLHIYDLSSPEHKNTAAVITALNKDDDKLYKLLDTYSAKLNSRGGKPRSQDGVIGQEDLSRFLADAKNPQTEAGKYAQANPEGFQAISQLSADWKNKGFNENDLLSSLNFGDRKDLEDYMAKHGGEVPAAAGAIDDPKHPQSIEYKGGPVAKRDFTYDNGQITSIKETPNGGGAAKTYTIDPKTGLFLDEQGKTTGISEPQLSPNVASGYDYTFKTTDLKGNGQVNSHTVKSDGTQEDYIAAPQTYGGPTPEGVAGKVGGLDVKGDKDGRPNQQVVSGDNLWSTARKILGVTSENEDPQQIQAIITKIAAANNIKDPNLIDANTELVIPANLVAV